MSLHQRRIMRGTVFVAAILLAQQARAGTNPLELGDEAIWLGDTTDITLPVESESAAQSDDHTDREAPIDTAAAQQSAAPIADPTPLHRMGAEAGDSEAGKTAPSRGASNWWRTLVSLAAVVGLIALLAWGYKLTGGLNGGTAFLTGARRTQLLEVVGRTSLTPRHSVCLVRAGGRVVLVGLSGDRMSPLDVVTDSEAAKLLGLAAQERSGSAQAAFERTLVEESAQYASEPVANEVTELEQRRSSAQETIANTLARLRSRVGRGIEQKAG